MRSLSIFSLLAVLFLTGCASDGDISNIFWRKLTWESYISGDDIAAKCDAGQEFSSYRYLYNANRAKQVLVFNWDEEQKILKVDDLRRGVFLEGSLGRVEDIWALFNPEHRNISMQDDFFGAAAEAAAMDAKTAGINVGEQFSSAQHFTIISQCVDGDFDLNIVTQAQMQASYPQGLNVIRKYLEEKEGGDLDLFPALPEDQAVDGAVPLKRQGDEESYIHYLMTRNSDGVEIGQGYPFK